MLKRSIVKRMCMENLNQGIFLGVGKQTVANLTNLSQLQNLCGDIFSPLHKICLCVNMFNSPAEVHQTP